MIYTSIYTSDDPHDPTVPSWPDQISMVQYHQIYKYSFDIIMVLLH